MEEEFTHALYQLSSPDHVAKKIVTEILTDDSDGSEEVSSLSFSQELGSRLQQIGDVTKALEVLLYCLELDRGIVSHSEFDPNAEFEANDPRGRLFASSKGRSIIAESLKQVVQSRWAWISSISHCAKVQKYNGKIGLQFFLYVVLIM